MNDALREKERGEKREKREEQEEAQFVFGKTIL